MTSLNSTPMEDTPRYGIASSKRIAPEPVVTPRDRYQFLRAIEESLTELVAQAIQIEDGKYPKAFKSAPPETQDRASALARRTLRMIDPDVRVAAAAKAAGQMDAVADEMWARGVDLPSTIDTAREAISRYEALLSAPEVGQ